MIKLSKSADDQHIYWLSPYLNELKLNKLKLWNNCPIAFIENRQFGISSF